MLWDYKSHPLAWPVVKDDGDDHPAALKGLLSASVWKLLRVTIPFPEAYVGRAERCPRGHLDQPLAGTWTSHGFPGGVWAGGSELPGHQGVPSPPFLSSCPSAALPPLQVYYSLWRTLLKAFWWLVVAYTMLVLIAVYTFQFEDFPAYWRNITGLTDEQ